MQCRAHRQSHRSVASTIHARNTRLVSGDDNLAGNHGRRPTHGVNLRREGQNLCINETCVAIIWDEPMPNVGRLWFGCACGRKVRYLYLRETIRCAKCHGLQKAILHQGRQTPYAVWRAYGSVSVAVRCSPSHPCRWLLGVAAAAVARHSTNA